MRPLRWIVDGPPWRGSLVAALIFLAVSVPRIAQPPVYVFDEVYQAFTAGRYAAGDRDAYVWSTKATGPTTQCAYEWVHPPLAKLILAASITALGDGPLGWRLPCAMAGALLIVLVLRLGRRLRLPRGAPELAALALAADGLVLVLSRIGMSDVFVAVFVVAAYGAFARHLDARATAPTWRWLYFTGACLGLAVATKWFGLLAWGWIGLCTALLASVTAARWLRTDAPGRLRAATVPFAHIAVALILLPAAIYLAAYIPFFAQGYIVGDFIELIRQQVLYHANLKTAHDYASAWWKWPLLVRSVWLWTSSSDGIHRDIYMLGNPALWWAMLPALGWIAWNLRRTRQPDGPPRHAAGILVLGFLGQWLPWALPARPAFLFYFLTALPFGALAVGWMVAHAAGTLRRGRFLAVAYAALLIVAAAFLYPLWTGLPIPEAGWNARLLLLGWR